MTVNRFLFELFSYRKMKIAQNSKERFSARLCLVYCALHTTRYGLDSRMYQRGGHTSVQHTDRRTLSMQSFVFHIIYWFFILRKTKPENRSPLRKRERSEKNAMRAHRWRTNLGHRTADVFARVRTSARTGIVAAIAAVVVVVVGLLRRHRWLFVFVWRRRTVPRENSRLFFFLYHHRILYKKKKI